MAHLLKWKFRECHPKTKGQQINRYIDYVTEQVKHRRSMTGEFANTDPNITIGMEDEFYINDKLESSSSETEYNQAKYLQYINERKGSGGCFSNDGADMKSLTKSLKQHDGAVWIPIVSLKEDEAREYGLDTEAAWMIKARELAEEYRKALGIESENYRWMAAFHIKSKADQNVEADAGCQPHLHFMIWEETPIRRVYKMNDYEMEKIHKATARILSKEFMERQYEERNRLREEIKESSISNLDYYASQVAEFANDIAIITGGKGKLNAKTLEKRANQANDIYTKMESGKKLTEKEEYMKSLFGIETVEDAKTVLASYNNLNNRLDELATMAMNLDETKQIVYKWADVSSKMRQAQSEPLQNALLSDDYKAIEHQIKNAILKEVKHANYENPKISDKFKGMLYSRVTEGIYKTEDLTFSKILKTTEVISQLYKAAGAPEEKAIEDQVAMLARSDLNEFEETVKEVIASVYQNYHMGAFNVTTMDFWNVMKNLQGYKNPNYAVPNMLESTHSPYLTSYSTVLSPIVNTMLKNPTNVSALLDANNSWMLNPPQNTIDYEQRFNALLSLFETEDDDIKRTKELELTRISDNY